MVLVSIIMGIGVTTLLRGTIDLFRADADTRPSAVHLLWVLNLLLLHIVVWIIRWRAGGQAGWSFGEILLFLFVPIILFASAEWVFPPAGREVDLSTYFYDNRRVFFLLQGVLSLAMAIGPTLFFGGTGSSFTDFGSLFALPFVVLLAWSSNKKLHLFGALFWLFSLLFVGFRSLSTRMRHLGESIREQSPV